MRYTIKQLLRCFFIVSIVINIYFLHKFKIKWNDRRTWLKIFKPMYVTSSRNMLKKTAKTYKYLNTNNDEKEDSDADKFTDVSFEDI